MREKNENKDYDLMEGFRAGHHKSFTEVFNLLYAPLCHYAASMIKEENAEDIVEESFIKVWGKKEIFFEIAVLKSYLYTTVKNACVDHLRKNKSVYFLDEEFNEIFEGDNCQALTNLIKAEVYNQLLQAVEKLPVRGRQIIRMIYFDGKKPKTVAKELGLAVSSVKTHKVRAITSLKKEIGL